MLGTDGVVPCGLLEAGEMVVAPAGVCCEGDAAVGVRGGNENDCGKTDGSMAGTTVGTGALLLGPNACTDVVVICGLDGNLAAGELGGLFEGAAGDGNGKA